MTTVAENSLAFESMTAVDHRYPVGQLVRLVEVLGGQQNGGAAREQVLDDLPHGHARAGIEASGGLVQEQHRRRRNQADRQVEPPAHTARIGLGRPSGGLDQIELLEQLLGPDLGAGGGEAVQLAHHDQVLAPGQQLVHRRRLAGQADHGADLVGLRSHIVTVDQGGSAVEAEQGAQDPDDGGFAGAVGAEQRQHGAPLDLQVDALQDLVLAIGLGQVPRFDYVVGARHRVFWINAGQADGPLRALIDDSEPGRPYWRAAPAECLLT
jgi:hypothetical protein